MQLLIFTEPQQGASHDTLARMATASEEYGYAGFFRSDHLLAIGDGDDGLPGPTDAWLTLAALATVTQRIRLGTLMTAATFRPPGLLAVQVAQADVMSGGRVEIGIGTGWFEREHVAYGIPFPPLAERFARLEEELEILTGLWRTPLGTTFSYPGTYYQLVDSPALPKPAQPSGPPVIIGGKGARRTPRLAATYADEFNMPFQRVAETREQYDRVRDACLTAGRDPGKLRLSAAVTVCCGRDDAETSRRVEAIGVHADELRTKGVAGTPAQVVEALAGYAEAGAERLYLRLWDLDDLDHLELIAAEVAPHLASA
jgi:F420-dependent oxidoreductase-like protein